MPSLTWLLVSYGICFGIQNDKIKVLSDFLRRSSFGERMLSCAYCTGFHCGWITWLLALTVGEEKLSAGILSWALASSAFCYIMDSAVRWLESNTQSE